MASLTPQDFYPIGSAGGGIFMSAIGSLVANKQLFITFLFQLATAESAPEILLRIKYLFAASVR